MEPNDIGETLRRAADSIRKNPAMRRRANVCYARAAKAGYEVISGLQEDGYSYEALCEAFIENGLLFEGANPKALCTAFLREKRRREKRKAQAIGATQKATSSVAKASSPVKQPEQEAPALDEKAARRERVRKMTGVEVDTGLGKIVKHTDGSFEF